jgi:methylenetetrahydrofolate reductase (NADPH)
MIPDRTSPAQDRLAPPLGQMVPGEILPELEISFEFFPPKTPAAEARLWQTVEQLQPLSPHYVSVTCGAGGNPAEGTRAWALALGERAGWLAVAHLTCASATREAVDDIARQYWAAGVHRLVALRGDRPKDTDSRPNGAHYPFAADLVEALCQIAPFEISVAAYPETHPEASSPEADLDNLKRKLDAGAVRAITQYCFETETILRFRDRMAAAGITAPLAAGIMPVHDFAQIKRFSDGCGAGVPGWLAASFQGLDDDPAERQRVAAGVAAEQIRRLVAEGIRQLHFYTLNRAELTLEACRLLGLQPRLANAA